MSTKYSDKSEPHYLRAVEYEEAGRIADAIREYRMANRIKKDLIPARKRFGDLLLRLGRVDEAIQQYVKGTEITSQKRKWKRILVPDDEKYSLLQVLDALSHAYQVAGDSEHVRETQERILSIEPANDIEIEIVERAKNARDQELTQETDEMAEASETGQKRG
ncbi:MAG: hypothetical protein OWS74_05050 [Firmicutes bacterium]|nr:hypothetical protein [Bacillota bacterium]